MSWDRVESMLEDAENMRVWIASSKTTRWMRYWNDRVKNNVFSTLALSCIGMAWVVLNSASATTPLSVLNIFVSNMFLLCFLMPLLSFGLISYGVNKVCSRVWNKKTFFTGSRNFDHGLRQDTTEIKACVAENFMKLHGEEWDELAPLLNKVLEEDALPFMWWWDLNTHIAQNISVAPIPEPTVQVESISVEVLEDQLKHHASQLKNNTSSLSI